MICCYLKSVITLISRLFLLIIFALPSTTAHASCEGRQLNLVFAPAFGAAFLKEFFSEVIAVFEEAQCDVTITHVASFIELFAKIRAHEGQVLIMPSAYNQELKKLDYVRTLSGFDGLVGYVVVRRNGQILRLRDLIGKTIYLNDPYSMGKSEWIRITKEYGLYKQVAERYAGSMDQLLFRIINGEIEATFTVDLLFERLPQNFRDKLLVIHRNRMASPASILFSESLPEHLIKTLSDQIESASTMWSSSAIPNYELDDEFLQSVRQKLGIVTP